MRYLKFTALLLVLVFLFAACASEGSSNRTADGTQPESEGQTLPQPNVPASEDTKAVSDPAAEGTDAPSSAEEAVPASDTDTGETEGPASTVKVSDAFTALFPTCPEAVTAVLVNAPFPNGKPDATVQWNSGDYDQLCLVPRFIGSIVNVYRLTADEEGQLFRDPDPAFSGTVQNGSVFEASLERPEGFPAWYVEIITPEGASSGMTLEYNGRTGTPACEFICAAPAQRDDLVTAVYDANIVPLSVNELNAFIEAARKAGLDPWEAADRFFSQLEDIGDNASFIMSYGHEMAGNAYSFRMAKIHQNYLIEAYGIDEIVTGQYSIYEQVGNELGILGPEFSGELPDLTWKLTGLTVFNKLLAAKEIQVAVNGEGIGTYTLPQDQFAVLIPVEVPDQIADRPVDIEITVVSTWYGEPSGAQIDAYGGLSSNISGAR